jgi:hypothetical protein
VTDCRHARWAVDHGDGRGAGPRSGGRVAPPCRGRPPSSTMPPSRAWPCWGPALPAALPAAAGPRRQPPRRAGDATPRMAQDTAPRDHAATVPLVAGTRHPPPADAVEPARACFPPQPHRCRSLRPPRRPRTPARARAAPTSVHGRQRSARMTVRPLQRTAPDAGPGTGGHGLLLPWATPSNKAAPSNPTKSILSVVR